jgi:hypothetical protein
MRNNEEVNEQLDGATAELEAALRRMRLSPVCLNRDELIFNAGAASARRQLRVWRGTAVALAACVGIGVCVQVEMHRSPTIASYPVPEVSRAVVVYEPARAANPYSLASLNRAVRGGGIDAIPMRSAADTPRDASLAPARPQTLIQSLSGDPL